MSDGSPALLHDLQARNRKAGLVGSMTGNEDDARVLQHKMMPWIAARSLVGQR
jgi:hypothetical protein